MMMRSCIHPNVQQNCGGEVECNLVEKNEAKEREIVCVYESTLEMKRREREL